MTNCALVNAVRIGIWRKRLVETSEQWHDSFVVNILVMPILRKNTMLRHLRKNCPIFLHRPGEKI